MHKAGESKENQISEIEGQPGENGTEKQRKEMQARLAVPPRFLDTVEQ